MRPAAPSPSPSATVPSAAPLTWLLVASAPFALANAAFAIIAPLWVVGDLGEDAAGWATLRALRFVGTIVGSIAIGVASARCDARRMTIAAIAVAGVATALMAHGHAVAWLMPVLGAAVSAAFVGFNTLVQSAWSPPATANAWYRAVGALAAVAAAPAIALAGAGGRIPPTAAVAATALVFGVAALALTGHPTRASEASTRDVGWRGYLGALRSGRLLRLGLLVEAAGIGGAATAAFAALRLTYGLGMTVSAYAWWTGAAGVASVAAIALCGRVRAETAPRILGWLAVVAGLATAAIAGCDSVPAVGLAFIVASVATTAASAPLSLALTHRAGGLRLDCVFAAHKTLQAVVAAAQSALFALLEPVIGLRLVLGLAGIATLVTALVLVRSRRTSA